MDELAAKLSFVEARLTLLERQFARLTANPRLLIDKPTEPIVISCCEPGMMISRMYREEKDKEGNSFCWVGNDGPIQFLIPVPPSYPLTCTLHIQPHPNVDLNALSILANDEQQEVTLTRPSTHDMNLTFPVAASGAPSINVMLVGITSIRPSDYGENRDNRLLAARFYGATIVFD